MPLLSDDSRQEIFQALLDEQSELRDANFLNPDAILVYDEEQGTIQECNIIDLPLRYPAGPGNRWSYEDLGRIVAKKSEAYRQSLIAYEISDADFTASPACSTAVLWITSSYRPYKRLRITANIIPGQNDY